MTPSVIFSLKIDGSDYTVKHTFGSATDDASFVDGNSAYGSLALSGNFLYGMTHSGGIYDKGIIFKSSVTGDNYGSFSS